MLNVFGASVTLPELVLALLPAAVLVAACVTVQGRPDTVGEGHPDPTDDAQTPRSVALIDTRGFWLAYRWLMAIAACWALGNALRTAIAGGLVSLPDPIDGRTAVRWPAAWAYFVGTGSMAIAAVLPEFVRKESESRGLFVFGAMLLAALGYVLFFLSAVLSSLFGTVLLLAAPFTIMVFGRVRRMLPPPSSAARRRLPFGRYAFTREAVDRKLRGSHPLSTGELLGTGVGCFVMVAYVLWNGEPHSFRELFPFLALLFVAAVIGVAIVLVRRLFVPSRTTLENTFVELTSGGVWKTVSGRRTLLLGNAEIREIVAHRSRFKILQRVEFKAKRQTVVVHDLGRLESFLAEARSRFARATFREVREDDELQE